MAPSESICSIPDCNDQHHARGFCKIHYNRWKKHGSTADPTPTAEQRLWANVIRRGRDECWKWTGGCIGAGYGTLTVEGRRILAHRYCYELLVGPIPKGLDLDHTCHNEAVKQGLCKGGFSCVHRKCVNPYHMEAIDNRTNQLRGASLAAANARKTHCINGHPFDLFNTSRTRKTRRRCRTCANAINRRSYRRKQLKEQAQ